METDSGLVGYGESTSSFPAQGAVELLANIVPGFIGQSAFDIDRLISLAKYLGLINDTVRMPNLLLAGLEMALWDLTGKAAGRPPPIPLWGGAVRDYVDYFGFVQGDTPEELAASAKELRALGREVIYMKIGRGRKSDFINTRAVREAIGDGVRLRLDANEAWDVFTAKNMINRLAEFDIDFIEQPLDCRLLTAMRQTRQANPVPIAVDQGNYSLEEVYAVCRAEAADVIVLSPAKPAAPPISKKRRPWPRRPAFPSACTASSFPA